MEVKRIDIEIIDMKHQETFGPSESFIEIDQNKIRWWTKFSAKEPKDKEDLYLGYTEEEYEWDVIVKRSAIVAVELILGTPEDFEKHWMIEIVVNGRGGDLKLYFKESEKSKAKELFDELVAWAL